MQNFMKTILSAVQTWTKGKIKDSTADWNENDSSADSYVKNRTHWEEEAEVAFLPETTIEGFELWDSESNSYGFSIDSKELILGKFYTVVWDGVRYDDLICYDVEGYLTIGAAYGDYSEYSFGISYYAEDGILEFYTNSVGASHIISIASSETVVHTLDAKYLPDEYATVSDVETLQNSISEVSNVANTAQTTADTAQTTANSKMNVADPVGKGSFSMNRKAGSTVGSYSHAVGRDATASSMYSHAEGYNTTATHSSYTASFLTTTSNGYCAHAEGYGTVAYGRCSHAEGNGTTASSMETHAEGYGTSASSPCQHVQGKYNIEDSAETYAHIVGNGTYSARSNAHTLDWNGVGWYQGGLQVGGNAQGDGAKNVLLEGDAIPAPFFDFAALGLGAITPDGGTVSVTTDTTTIMEALTNGSIKVGFNFNLGATVYGTAVVNPMYIEAMGMYQCVFIGNTNAGTFIVYLNINSTGITAFANTMSIEAGADGKDGVGIHSIEQTTIAMNDGGVNEFTVMLTNGESQTWLVRNGSKGSAGENGEDGYTPVRGTDYWTEEDKAEIKAYVDEAILGGAW